MEWFKVEASRTVRGGKDKEGKETQKKHKFESEVLGLHDRILDGALHSAFLVYDDEYDLFVWVPMGDCKLLETSE